MSDILQITTPVLPRNYTPQTATPTQQEAFQLADLTHVVQTQERSAQQQQDNADYTGENALKLTLVVSQDPSAAADSLKSLLTEEILSMLKTSESISFLDELTALADEIMLSPEQIPADMAEQAQNSTIFKGEIFDMLRSVLSQSENVMGGSEIRNAITALLKSFVNSASSNDVMTSLSNTLKYMSEEMYASRSLSEELSRLSKEFAQPDALSRLGELKEQLAQVMKDVNGSLLLTDNIKSMLPLVTYNLSRIQNNPASLGEAFAKLLDVIPAGDDVKQALSQAFTKFVTESDILPDDVKSAVLGRETVDVGMEIADRLTEVVEKNVALINPEKLKDALGELPSDNGFVALKEVLALVVPEKNSEVLDRLIDNFVENKDMNSLVEQLSKMLGAIENNDIKLPLAQKLNEVLEKILQNGGEEIKYEKPTAMEGFTNFLLKNIGDGALKTVASFDRQSLMSSLLTAPGVYTPLLHFLVPLEIDNRRAFGEVWIDNDTEGKSGGGYEDGDSFHVLLDFSIENVGDFELEIATKDTDMSVNLLCPTSFSKSFGNLKSTISRLASAKGYSVKNSNIGVLTERRTLTQVFPRIAERRNGLNVTA